MYLLVLFQFQCTGLMTVVPCSSTPGLSIFDTELGEWIAVEGYLQFGKEIAVFPDKVLELLSNDLYRAAVHR